MIFQNIIVGIIISLSVLYAVYNIIKTFTPKKEDSACGCKSCDFKTKIDEIKPLANK